ncbi:MAG: zinc-ribbon domain-containing protein [Candidatus Lokiarchaeota archaeon]
MKNKNKFYNSIGILFGFVILTSIFSLLISRMNLDVKIFNISLSSMPMSLFGIIFFIIFCIIITSACNHNRSRNHPIRTRDDSDYTVKNPYIIERTIQNEEKNLIYNKDDPTLNQVNKNSQEIQPFYIKKETKVKYCSFCGEELDNKVRYCPMCGNKIVDLD